MLYFRLSPDLHYGSTLLDMQFKMVTALFWYAIQNYPGVTALARMIRSVLYMGKNSLDVNGDTDLKLQQKNMAQLPGHPKHDTKLNWSHIPAAHIPFLFCFIQFPFLLVAKHKLRYFFLFKTAVVTIPRVGTTIALCVLAHVSGDIWKQHTTYCTRVHTTFG